jgi:hypothetical protein
MTLNERLLLAVVCLFIFNVTVRWPWQTALVLLAIVTAGRWIMMRDEDHHDRRWGC